MRKQKSRKVESFAYSHSHTAALVTEEHPELGASHNLGWVFPSYSDLHLSFPRLYSINQLFKKKTKHRLSSTVFSEPHHICNALSLQPRPHHASTVQTQSWSSSACSTVWWIIQARDQASCLSAPQHGAQRGPWWTFAGSNYKEPWVGLYFQPGELTHWCK